MPHDHPHGPTIDAKRLAHYQCMAVAVQELLTEKGVLTDEQIETTIKEMEARGPALGARMVARAWIDSNYKRRLLLDGSAAAEELGIPVDGTRLIVVENNETMHNLIVCTLCSCYPRNILGLPPDWYKKTAYRSRAVKEPRAVLAEFGTFLPDSVTVRVHDSTADMRYLVLPTRPAGTEGWTEQRLIQLVSRDSMIGVRTAKQAES
jgi:nitrile hydratase